MEENLVENNEISNDEKVVDTKKEIIEDTKIEQIDIEKDNSLLNFLQKAKESLKEMEEKKKNLHLLEGKKSTYEKNDKDLNKAKEKLIKETTEKREKDLKNSFNQKIVELDKALKKANQEKEKEKEKIIKEKVEASTKTTKENILFLQNNLNNLIQNHKITPFVNCDLYYYIIAPSKISEYLVGGLIFAFCFGVIPIIIVLIFQSKMTFWMIVMTFLISVFVFGSLYLFLCHIGKVDKDLLSEIKSIRQDIKDNKNKVVQITKEVKEDKESISSENYTRVDRIIEGINVEIKNVKESEEKALETFENSTKNEIINEIENVAKKDINANIKNLKQTTIELEEAKKSFEEFTETVEKEYIEVLGKENFAEKSINKLIELATKDTSLTLEKALELAKK